MALLDEIVDAVIVVYDEYKTSTKIENETLLNILLLAYVYHARIEHEKLFSDKYNFLYIPNVYDGLAENRINEINNDISNPKYPLSLEAVEQLSASQQNSIKRACEIAKNINFDINKGFKDKSLPWNGRWVKNIPFEQIRDYFSDDKNYMKLFPSKGLIKQREEIEKTKQQNQNILDALDYAKQARAKLLEKFKNDGGMEK